ncbi:DUF4956 domain-containing protein [Planctomycetota bacterium]
MDELIKETLELLRTNGGQGTVLNLWEVVFAMSLCLLCSVVVGWVYRFTHKNVSYSQSFAQTLILTALVTTLIMIVIGSNIARAFSLVGALSIIRFRNAVKETRDVSFIFFSMAIAMSCGTRFYSVAILATCFIGIVLIIMHLTNYGKSNRDPERMLRVQLPPDKDIETTLGDTLKILFNAYSIVVVESVRQGMYHEILFSVSPKSGITATFVIDEISKVNDNLKITYNYSAHTEEL